MRAISLRAMLRGLATNKRRPQPAIHGVLREAAILNMARMASPEQRPLIAPKLMELDESIHRLIKTHCAKGDALADGAQYEAAVAAYNQAWELVPEPKTNWNASTWILAAIGDACFLGGYATSSKGALSFALTCPGGSGNPFIHMRLGQLAYDAGDLDAAADELMRAYMGAGDEIFENEDRRYLTFLGTRAKL